MPSSPRSGPATIPPQVGSTITAPPLPITSRSGSSAGKSSGNAAVGMYCGTATTNAPDSMAIARMWAIQPSESSAVGATQICGACR